MHPRPARRKRATRHAHREPGKGLPVLCSTSMTGTPPASAPGATPAAGQRGSSRATISLTGGRMCIVVGKTSVVCVATSLEGRRQSTTSNSTLGAAASSKTRPISATSMVALSERSQGSTEKGERMHCHPAASHRCWQDPQEHLPITLTCSPCAGAEVEHEGTGPVHGEAPRCRAASVSSAAVPTKINMGGDAAPPSACVANAGEDEAATGP
mmetsp:Transcript_133141/g.425944  ORF Transcript_133141/g.425944 Transcript_133141/m.425944 type:complete len:212 (+) Transcript_133141:499-1134(+)